MTVEPEVRTARQARAARGASGAQLWRLNDLALLGGALERGSGGWIDAAVAADVLKQAALRGEWEPPASRGGSGDLGVQRERVRLAAERDALVTRTAPASDAVAAQPAAGELEPSCAPVESEDDGRPSHFRTVSAEAPPTPDSLAGPSVAEDELPVALLPSDARRELAASVVAASVGEAVERADERDADAEGPATAEHTIEDGDPLVEPLRTDAMEAVRVLVLAAKAQPPTPGRREGELARILADGEPRIGDESKETTCR